jgi:hypothetical protein
MSDPPIATADVEHALGAIESGQQYLEKRSRICEPDTTGGVRDLATHALAVQGPDEGAALPHALLGVGKHVACELRDEAGRSQQ